MQTIEWDVTTVEGGDNTVSILLSSNSGGSYSTLVTSIDGASGEYLWDTTVGPSGPLSDGATYRIKVVNPSTALDDSSNADFIVDNTAPVTSFAIDPVGPDGDNDWYVVKPTVILSCDDNLSGCFSISYSWNGVDFTEVPGDEVSLAGGDIPEGENTLSFFSRDEVVDKDGAHNEEDVQTENFKVDTVAPSVAAYTLNGGTETLYFNPATGEVEVTITASEPVHWTTVRIQNLTDDGIRKDFHPTDGDPKDEVTVEWEGDLSAGVLVDGDYEVNVRTMKDVAGNTVEHTVLAPHLIVVDTVSPEISDFTAPEADAVYKDGVGVPLVFTPTDSAPGTPLTCGYKVNDGGDFVSPGACVSEVEFVGVLLDEDLTDGRNNIFTVVRDSANNEEV